MTAIAVRNLKIFFRDKANVFFSLLGVIIIIGLYVLFLGDMMVQQLQEIPGARFLTDSWIMAGVMAVTSITTTMGAFGIMVEDRSKKLLKDFSASPLKRRSLAAGYILSSYLIGVLISLLAFFFAECYIVFYGGHLLSLFSMIKMLGCILLSVLASSAMVFFATSFFRSVNAFTAGSTILGTLIGFLTGVYIPVGTLPGPIQWVVKLFPVSHSGTLFRQIMMERPMQESFLQLPAETMHEFAEDMGVRFMFGSHTVTAAESVGILVLTVLVFYGLAILNISRKRK